MRLTTKIFIGFLISILSLILVFMIYMKTKEEERVRGIYGAIVLERDVQAVEIPKYKVIYIDSLRETGSKAWYLRGSINLEQGSPGRMYINKEIEPFTKTELKGDTLFVSFDAKGISKRMDIEESKYHGIRGLEIGFHIDKEVKLISDMQFLHVSAADLEVDTLDMSLMSGNVSMNNTKIGTLSIKNNIKIKEGGYIEPVHYIIKDCRIGSWDIDLKYLSIKKSSFENSKVNTLNVSAYDKNTLPDIEYDVLNWNPLGDEAELKLSLKKVATLKQGD